MMKTDFFELKPSIMTILERIQYPATFEVYLDKVFRMQFFSEPKPTLTEAEVLALAKLEDIKAVQEKYPFRFLDSEGENGTVHWYDMQADMVVMPQNQQYGTLFAFKLRQINLMDLDDFLAFHLEKYHGGHIENYLRFLTLMLRSCTGPIIPASYAVTVQEWMQAQKTGEEITVKTKGKIKRTPEDGKTLMNQEETTLLIHFMQQARIILQDEYLNNKEAGIAFSMLTGYSPDSIRQKLGKTELPTAFTKKNLEGLHKSITRLEVLISKAIQHKKQDSSRS